MTTATALAPNTPPAIRPAAPRQGASEADGGFAEALAGPGGVKSADEERPDADAPADWRMPGDRLAAVLGRSRAAPDEAESGTGPAEDAAPEDERPADEVAVAAVTTTPPQRTAEALPGALVFLQQAQRAVRDAPAAEPGGPAEGEAPTGRPARPAATEAARPAAPDVAAPPPAAAATAGDEPPAAEPVAGTRSAPARIVPEAETEAPRADGPRPQVTVVEARSFPTPGPQPTAGDLATRLAAAMPTLAAPAAALPDAAPAHLPSGTLKLQLHPAELGMVTASLRVSGKVLSVEIQVETAEAYRRLSIDGDTLVKSLRGAGYDIDSVTVLPPASTVTAPARADAGQAAAGGPAARDGGSSWTAGGGGQAAGGSGQNPGGSGGQARQQPLPGLRPGEAPQKGAGIYI